MSESLIDKIRKCRQGVKEVNEFTFNFTRPTDIQMAELYTEFGENYNKYEICKRFITGWNVKESDLIEGGSNEVAPFELDLFTEWLADARDYWSPLYEAIMLSYVNYANDRESKVKN